MTDKVLVLRTCAADMTAHEGFKWPESGPVEAPDWNPEPVCGHGLHGLLWGEGAGALLDWSTAARWLVVEVEAACVVHLDGKVKFPRGEVVCCGDRKTATDYLLARAPGRCVVGAFLVGGDDSTVSGGNYSTVSGGNRSTISGGDYSTVSGGDYSTVSGGNYSTISGGNASTVSGGERSTVSGGNGSTVSGGYRSTVSGGYRSTVSGGDCSSLSLRWWDGTRYRITVMYVGEDGIEAGVPYRLDEHGKPVRALLGGEEEK